RDGSRRASRSKRDRHCTREKPGARSRRPEPQCALHGHAPECGRMACAGLADVDGRARRVKPTMHSRTSGVALSDRRVVRLDAMRWASRAMLALEKDIACALRCDLNVMLSGERGVGK